MREELFGMKVKLFLRDFLWMVALVAIMVTISKAFGN
jgi:hypothetical protein